MKKTPDWFGFETVTAVVVALLGILWALDRASYYGPAETVALVVIALAVAGIVAICRRRPGLALGLVWTTAIAHLVLGMVVLPTELSFVIVAFATARWGSPATVVASALSIPAFSALVLVSSSMVGYGLVSSLDGYDPFVTDAFYGLGVPSAYVAVALVALILFGVPWLAGLALRFSDRASASEAGLVLAEEQSDRARHESVQALEIARLRDEQARLARDVHDVVGHSLAVILAQAESAQYAPDGDTETLKATMATIATSARSSLQDVRHVLTAAADSSDQEPAPTPTRALDTLIEGVRTSGHEVLSREDGTPQPLPPDLEVVAYRVLQEMLTNAIRHGSRQEPVRVERHWPDGAWAGELRIEVRNSVGPDEGGEGQGLEGMRRRLEACGGRLDVRRREGERPGEPATFTTTAWVPVRTVSP